MKRLSKRRLLQLGHFSANWIDASDSTRAQWRGVAIGRFVRFWERIRSIRKWQSVATLSTDPTERRWMRRQLLYLEAAGLIERRMLTGFVCEKKNPGRETQFRRRRTA